MKSRFLAAVLLLVCLLSGTADATVGTATNLVTAEGNGSTVAFSYNFRIPSIADLIVIYTDASGNQTTLSPTQYTVTGIGTPNGGTVTYPISGGPIASGTTLTIERLVPYLQTTSIANQGPTFAAIEGALDNTVYQTQQLAAQEGRAIQIPAVDGSGINTVLPPAAQRANQFLGFDSLGNATAATPSGSGIPISAAMQPVVEAATVREAAQLMDVRPGLTNTLTLYVNGSTGNDGNSGTNPSLPLLTLQAAVNIACASDLLGHSFLVDASDGGTYTGTYAAPSTCTIPGYSGALGQAQIVIQGAASHSSTCSGYPTVNGPFSAVGIPEPWTFTNLNLTGQFEADAGSWVAFDGDCFGASPSGPNVIAVNAGSKIEFIRNPFTINGSAAGGFAIAELGGEVLWQNVASPVTITGTPSEGGQFVSAAVGGSILCQDITFSGSVAASTMHAVVDQTSSIACGKTGVTSNPNNVLPGDTSSNSICNINQAPIQTAEAGTPFVCLSALKSFSGGTGGISSTSNSTQYIGISSISSTENDYSLLADNYQSINLYVVTPTPPGAGQSYVFTLRIGGGNAPLTCTISNTSTTCNDTSHSVTITAGAAVDLQMVSSASAATTSVAWAIGYR